MRFQWNNAIRGELVSRSSYTRKIMSAGARAAVLVIMLWILPLAHAKPEPEQVLESLHTVAGDLKIVQQENLTRYRVTLDGRTVLKTDYYDKANPYADQVIPEVHTYYKSEIGDFQEVVLLQLHGGGNACNGGPFIFLGLGLIGKTCSVSKAIDFCGGAQPIFTWGANKVIVYIPGGPPNIGTGYIPSETWVYQKGKVTEQTKVQRKRPKKVKSVK